MPSAMSVSEICGRTSSIGTCGASWSRTVAAWRVGVGHVGADQQFGIELLERLAEVADSGIQVQCTGSPALRMRLLMNSEGSRCGEKTMSGTAELSPSMELPEGGAGSDASNKRGEFTTHPRGAAEMGPVNAEVFVWRGFPG
jgi:hypothetical protein